MESETSKKQYRAVDPVSRFRWALSFPGVFPAAGKVLAALADHADQSKLTCWPSVETLARETRVSVRGVQYALRSLEAAGAILTERSRGRTSSVYRLMIPPNPAIPAPLNPARSAPNPAMAAGFNPAMAAPNPAMAAGFNPARSAPQQSYSLEQSKEQQQQQRARTREAHANQPAAAAAAASTNPKIHPADKRHVCPQCANTWPKQFGAICFKCQCDVELAHRREEWLAEIAEADNSLVEATPPPKPPVSATAMRLLYAMGGSLPKSWVHHQGLKDLIGKRDLEEVCDVIVGIGPRKLPEPEPFFEAYNQHLQEHEQGEAELKALSTGTRQAA